MSDPSVPFEFLSWPRRCAILSKEFLGQTLRLVLVPLRRDRNQVMHEYDGGAWKNVLEAKEWLRASTLEDYLIPPSAEARIAILKGRLVRIRTSDYYRFRGRMIRETVENFSENASEIVEIGCGSGVNLFTLSLSGRWNRLFGFDISENGVAAGRETAAHFGLHQVEFGVLDLIRADDPGFSRLRGQTVFSYYCLEQLKYHTGQVIENLLKAGVRRAIHIEPTTELLKRWSLMDWINGVYITRNDYQNNLIQTLRKFEDQKRLRITHMERLGYAPTPRNDPVLVCWDSLG